MKTAVYSGSFNPLHSGHLQVMRHLYEQAGFDRVLLIVSPSNPFKDSSLSKSAAQRLEAARKAVRENGMTEHVFVDDIEMTLEGPSYTIRTLEALKKREPGEEFTLAVGADILSELPRWKEGLRIMKEFGVVVYPRKGFDPHRDRDEILRVDPDCRIRLLENAPRVDISSTQIRTMTQGIEIIQINISGNDRPGLASAFTSILAKYDAEILDIGQANIHQTLALGILVKTTPEVSGFLMKDLMFKASELGEQIRFNPVTIEEYDAWVKRQGKNRYIITLLGRTITASELSQVTTIISKYNLNIDAIKRLSGRKPLKDEGQLTKSSIEFSVRGALDDASRTEFQKELMSISGSVMDISFQKDNIFRRSRRLICFDMDSTLINTEVIDELAVRAGVGDEVKNITASAMRGEIDFQESFRRRVAMLKGLDENVMKEIASSLPYNEGLERLMYVLKKVGYKTAILSGGFTYFAKALQQKFGFDYVYANELEIEDGKLTGRYKGEIMDGRRKAELLRFLCSIENIELEQTVAVGDGANDLPMLNLAGLGIAYHAKPKVQAGARQSINTIGLDGILYFLGLKESKIVE